MYPVSLHSSPTSCSQILFKDEDELGRGTSLSEITVWIWSQAVEPKDLCSLTTPFLTCFPVQSYLYPEFSEVTVI